MNMHINSIDDKSNINQQLRESDYILVIL